MKTFKDFLNEQSLLIRDLKVTDKIILKDLRTFKGDFKFVKNINDYDFIIDFNNKGTNILIVKNNIVYGFMLSEYSGFSFKGTKIISIKNAQIHNDLKGKSLGYEMYKILLSFHIITNDKRNSIYSQKVWERLYKDFYTYKFNLLSGEISILSSDWKNEIWTGDKTEVHKANNIRVIASKEKLI